MVQMGGGGGGGGTPDCSLLIDKTQIGTETLMEAFFGIPYILNIIQGCKSGSMKKVFWNSVSIMKISKISKTIS